MKVLWVSDGYVKTGFARVAHSLIDRFPEDIKVHHIALNYKGEPHDYKHTLVPAISGGDIYGVNLLSKTVEADNFDLIFLFNDMPVIDMYLDAIKDKIDRERTKIVVYFPVDSEFPNANWFRHYNLVDEVITYTLFGKNQVLPIIPDKDIHILYHGVDFEIFHRIDKLQALKDIFGEELANELNDSFIVLNANRNQPRKRFDLTIAGFANFVKRLKLTPKDVRLYLHAGVIDAGYNLFKLIKFYDIEDYILFTKIIQYHPYVDDETLNLIYNASDASINTSTGEGFGLVPLEHGSLGKQIIVPDNSVHRELFGDNAYYIETPIQDWSVIYTTLFRSATPGTVSRALEEAFLDYKIGRAKTPFINKEVFNWDNIANQLLEILYGTISK